MVTKHTGSNDAKRDRNRQPSPGTTTAPKVDGQIAWVLEACARVMRPLVRLALTFGVKHAHLEGLLRDLLIDEARRAWLEKGTEPNISQLSVTTGLNRKAVTAKVREVEDLLPHTEMSGAAKTLTLWMQLYAGDAAYQSLAIAGEGRAPSFESVARQASRGNVHHRAILDELVRLNMAIERDGRAELNATAFVPAKDLKGMLAFLGDNARDHLLACVANTLGSEPPLLERSVFAAGISLEDCERLHQLVRQRWGGLHHELTQEMTRAFEAAEETASGRIRVGIYTYYEDGDVTQSDALAVVPPNRSSKKS
ncbi:DUF6502 family protein [Variovorax sp. RT4R15]|uniref:DUF6502 family protein n=1 Tax=Variovorax sp. RT4R15 TaxID=3443737 RepID=UPI003F4476FA